MKKLLVIITILGITNLYSRSYYSKSKPWSLEANFLNFSQVDDLYGAWGFNVKYGKADSFFGYLNFTVSGLPGVDFELGAGYDFTFLRFSTKYLKDLKMGITPHLGFAFGYLAGGMDMGYFEFIRVGAAYRVKMALNNKFGFVVYPLDITMQFVGYYGGNIDDVDGHFDMFFATKAGVYWYF